MWIKFYLMIRRIYTKKIILITGIIVLCLCGTKVYANTFHHQNQTNYNHQSWNVAHHEELQENQTNLHPCEFQNCTLKESHTHHQETQHNYGCNQNCPNKTQHRNSNRHHHGH